MESPYRIQCFLWMVLNGGLKTKAKRFHCNIREDDVCPLCLDSLESVIHSLRDCRLVKEVWNLSLTRNLLPNFFVGNLVPWIAENLQPRNNSWHVFFVVTLWCIWHHRNRVVFSQITFNPSSVVHHARKVLGEIFVLNGPHLHIAPRYHQVMVGWSPPHAGWFKFNVDGSLWNGGGAATYGGVLRDSSGTWIFGFSRHIGTTTALRAELWGIRSALEIAWEKGVKHILLESDSRIAVHMVNQGVSQPHPCAPLVAVIKGLLPRDWMGLFHFVE
ncbi:Ribonuclease H domain [Sesbania bispinosa]|nr:Ribonuclease H domain [Sesbania bispinosa]